MSVTPEEHEFISELVAGDTAKRRPALGDGPMSTIDALRQQLADVSNERDAAVQVIREERAKTEAVRLRLGTQLNASEARNSAGGNTSDAVNAFNERHYGYEFPSEDLRHGALNLFCAGWFERHKLAQSAPATDEQGADAENVNNRKMGLVQFVEKHPVEQMGN